ncbi:Ldh family oxidoreductase [Thermanaerosceptrum fracticalcis]|uniref:Ldh family oxidoreductase n=1 Tax=Thermanaerosceptrum fracticalcis TaxID=1712410 RepID=A0A7G6E544_THEFR|nr:Ldh family oxidoreductase [Thermanaerosceptrum fracticalcis]QNB47198.1 Ldh family oxidoreductase [Thermanaerosceptrum fracticalcis]
MGEFILVNHEKLKEFCNIVFIHIGIEKEKAEIISDLLVVSDLRGVASHGVMRLPVYAKKALRGSINPKASLIKLSELSSVILYDGENGFGQINSILAMRECVKKSENTGACFSVIKNSNNFGAAGLVALEAARHGKIGIVFSNASPTMVPFGGSTPLLGTNPIAIAIPTMKLFPIVLDMATSAVARDKIKVYAVMNKEIPIGWALDKEGKNTTDPKAAWEGFMLPMAGAKGYGLAVMVDILTGVLSGGAMGHEIKKIYDESGQGVSHFLGAINIEPFIPYVDFQDRLLKYYEYIKSSPPADGFEKVYLPGELEYEIEKKRVLEGVPIPYSVMQEIKDLSKELGIETDFFNNSSYAVSG